MKPDWQLHFERTLRAERHRRFAYAIDHALQPQQRTDTMTTPRDLLTTLGSIVFENDFTVVRAKTTRNTYGNWRTQITIHRRKGDMEQTPLGYVRGENILWLDE